MQLADDAAGRVTIFSIEEAVVTPPAPGPPPGSEVAERSLTLWNRVGGALDSPQAPMILAAALVVILVLGLLLSRH
jgi:hypothetical protein